MNEILADRPPGDEEIIDLVAEELLSDLAVEELPQASLLCTWSCATTLACLSCPGSTASSGACASSHC